MSIREQLPLPTDWEKRFLKDLNYLQAVIKYLHLKRHSRETVSHDKNRAISKPGIIDLDAFWKDFERLGKPVLNKIVKNAQKTKLPDVVEFCEELAAAFSK